jgi:selenide,water dikinase
VIVASQTADDGAVYRLTDDLALIQTLDFFTPIVSDPYEFGAIAAANALSDVYAMGGRPVCALNIVAYPRKSDEMPLSALADILRGGADKAREAGIDILGGHTIDDSEPKYGLSVTGVVHPDRIWRNLGAQPGDSLVLTKPLGTGIVSTAVRKGEAPEALAREVSALMATLNRVAAEIAGDTEVHACTDVTGFGLLGHLREMLSDGRCGVRLSVAATPVIEQTRAFVERGFVPGGSRRNLTSVEPSVSFDGAVSDVDRLVLCDAQTSGGLLLAVPSDRAELLVAQLRTAHVAAAVVGEVVADHPGMIHVTP